MLLALIALVIGTLTGVITTHIKNRKSTAELIKTHKVENDKTWTEGFNAGWAAVLDEYSIMKHRVSELEIARRS